MEINQIILDELRSFRKETNEQLRELSERTTRIETQVAPLFDNGQPGVLTKLEGRVAELEKTDWKGRGFIGGLMLVFELVGHLIALKFGL